jgi:regulator of protease activity HflC (stomatin/prohibitin superfamily)
MSFDQFVSRLKKGKSLFNTITGAIVVIGVLLVCFSLSWGWFVIMFGAVVNLLVNSIQVIEPGYAGCLVILGNVQNESVGSGVHFIYPFISYYKVVNVQLQIHKDINTVKDQNFREVKLSYTLNYQVNPLYVHLVYMHVGEANLVGKILCPWLDDIMTAVINKQTYESINSDLEVVKEDIIRRYEGKLSSELRRIAGERIFKYVSLSITEIKFDDDFEKIIRQLAEVKKREELVLETAKQKKMVAENEAETLKIRAEAEADAMRLKGASENEVKKRLGEILHEHPELVKEVIARHLPKVMGGTPIINADKIIE